MSFTQAITARASQSPIKPLLLDGALGTLLPEESQNHALWSTHTVITNPEAIKKIHQDYISNGAEIILTSTYQTSSSGISKWFPELKYQDVLRKSIDIAEDAVKESQKKIYIAGSIGPYGASLANGSEYTGAYGNVSDADLVQFHQERLRILTNDPRVDLIAIETIPNFQEVKILIELMKKNKDKPYYLSLSVKEETLADGTSAQDLIQFFSEIEGPVAIGVNCLGLSDSLVWLKRLKPTGKNLVVYPNSGELWNPETRRFIENPTGTLSWAEYVGGIRDIGTVLIVGGCCRTTPESIGEIRASLDSLFG